MRSSPTLKKCASPRAMREMMQRSECKRGSILGVSKQNVREELESREAIAVTRPMTQAWARLCARSPERIVAQLTVSGDVRPSEQLQPMSKPGSL